jgi:hairy and enhancer of split, invertebrate
MKNMCYETQYQNIVSETNAIKSKNPMMVSSEPVSRTYQYRKVMKPMLERKRRARINRCLDELKELMVSAMQSEGENLSKLEKADVLELTVRHLHKLRRQQRLAHANPVINEDRFRAGFTHAANEVSRVLASIPGVDITLGTKLMTHLGMSLNTLDKNRPLSIQTQQQNSMFTTPPISPTSSLSSGYSSSRENGVSVIMTNTAHQTQLRTPTPTNDNNYEPLTPMSSRCSQSSSPQPIDYRSATPEYGLLKVVNFSQSPLMKTASASSLWRPF